MKKIDILKYDCQDLYCIHDKFGNEITRNTFVIFAKHGSNKHPTLDTGLVIAFGTHPSFKYAYIETDSGRIIRKDESEIIYINNKIQIWKN